MKKIAAIAAIAALAGAGIVEAQTRAPATEDRLGPLDGSDKTPPAAKINPRTGEPESIAGDYNERPREPRHEDRRARSGPHNPVTPGETEYRR